MDHQRVWYPSNPMNECLACAPHAPTKAAPGAGPSGQCRADYDDVSGVRGACGAFSLSLSLSSVRLSRLIRLLSLACLSFSLNLSCIGWHSYAQARHARAAKPRVELYEPKLGMKVMESAGKQLEGKVLANGRGAGDLKAKAGARYRTQALSASPRSLPRV